MINVRKFLDIDPDYKIKVYRRQGVTEQTQDDDQDFDETEVCLNFQKQGSTTINNMKIRELED
jgi:hypothetical protein